MAASSTRTVEVDTDLLERARQVADERGVAVPQLVKEALERELAEAKPDPHLPSKGEGDGDQPPLSCVGAFSSGRGDLSKLASEDVFEPEPFR